MLFKLYLSVLPNSFQICFMFLNPILSLRASFANFSCKIITGTMGLNLSEMFWVEMVPNTFYTVTVFDNLSYRKVIKNIFVVFVVFLVCKKKVLSGNNGSTHPLLKRIL